MFEKRRPDCPESLRSSGAFGARGSTLGLLSGALLASSVVACSAESGREGATDRAHESSSDAIQQQVNTLLETSALFENEAGAARMQNRDQSYMRLSELLGELASAANEAAHAGASHYHLERLSRLAGQLPVQVARVKRALRTSPPGGAPDPNLTRRLSQLQWAARSLSTSIREQQYELRYASSGSLDVGQSSELQALNGPLTPSSSWYVLSEGHVDVVDVGYEDDALGLSIHDESVEPAVERDPTHTILVTKGSAKVEVPDERFAFLGAVGTTVWLLPQGQLEAEAAGVLWPGIATDEVESGAFVDDVVEIRFKSVVGPNGFSVFESPEDEASSPLVLVDSEDGLPDALITPVSIHRHANWAFESSGVYLVRVQARGRLAEVPNNPWVSSPTVTLKFVVLP
ncbi:MAG TPA: choice-of-anchor M domain-containing protein [Polyangiaceae bacterium]|nr:choice-of-anchor M domain-containing protein [Polyangiaceae bacterium]